GALAAYDEAIRRLADPETAEGVRAVAAAAEARMLAGRYGESRRLAEDGLARARRLGLPLEEAEILGTLGVDLAFLGEAGPAVAALDEAVAVAEKAGRPPPLARAWPNRAEVLSGPLNRLTEPADAAAARLPRLPPPAPTGPRSCRSPPGAPCGRAAPPTPGGRSPGRWSWWPGATTCGWWRRCCGTACGRRATGPSGPGPSATGPRPRRPPAPARPS